MAHGMYEAPERVVRDGRLVCFKGERMTIAEAQRRGLSPKGAAPEKDARELESMTVPELEGLAAKLGADAPKGATKKVLVEAIRAQKAGE